MAFGVIPLCNDFPHNLHTILETNVRSRVQTFPA